MRASALGRTYALAVFVLSRRSPRRSLAAPAALAETGGAGVPPPPPPGPTGGIGTTPPPLTTPMPTAQLSRDGRTAIPPAAAPQAVKNAIYAANRIIGKPYRYGGGHRRFHDSGYDCSGTVSFALRGGGLLKRPLHSRAFMSWGERGQGPVDHRLHEPRPRLRGDRRPAVRHVRPRPARAALAQDRALEPRVHGAPPRRLLAL